MQFEDELCLTVSIAAAMFALSVLFAALAALLPLALAVPNVRIGIISCDIFWGSSFSILQPAVTEFAGPAATSTAKLHQLIKTKGKTYFGSATDNPELTNQAYLANLDDNTMFGQVTAANSFKWVGRADSSEAIVTY